MYVVLFKSTWLFQVEIGCRESVRKSRIRALGEIGIARTAIEEAAKAPDKGFQPSKFNPELYRVLCALLRDYNPRYIHDF